MMVCTFLPSSSQRFDIISCNLSTMSLNFPASLKTKCIAFKFNYSVHEGSHEFEIGTILADLVRLKLWGKVAYQHFRYFLIKQIRFLFVYILFL